MIFLVSVFRAKPEREGERPRDPSMPRDVLVVPPSSSRIHENVQEREREGGEGGEADAILHLSRSYSRIKSA
jgi:hypothetical protein